jgi:hypothetical protein
LVQTIADKDSKWLTQWNIGIVDNTQQSLLKLGGDRMHGFLFSKIRNYTQSTSKMNTFDVFSKASEISPNTSHKMGGLAASIAVFNFCNLSSMINVQ